MQVKQVYWVLSLMAMRLPLCVKCRTACLMTLTLHLVSVNGIVFGCKKQVSWFLGFCGTRAMGRRIRLELTAWSLVYYPELTTASI